MPQTYNIKVVQVGHDTYHAFYSDYDANYANEETALLAMTVDGCYDARWKTSDGYIEICFDVRQRRGMTFVARNIDDEYPAIDWVIEYRLFGMDEFKTIQG
jgi:hypothetical protein